jgi:cytochrome c553
MGIRKVVVVAVALLGFGAALVAQGNTARGEEKAAECAACHGPGGNSEVAEWPKLAGLDEAYIVAQLKAYQSGARDDLMMAPMAEGLTEQDMRDLGAYFASQRMRFTMAGPADSALMAQGERIYRAGVPARHVTACMVCHGPTGAGHPSAGFTRVGGQHAEYVFLQLQAYREGQRTDPLGMMGEVSKRMTDDEMRAVAAYVARLAQPADPGQ